MQIALGLSLRFLIKQKPEKEHPSDSHREVSEKGGPMQEVDGDSVQAGSKEVQLIFQQD